jgi:amino acid transporter
MARLGQIAPVFAQVSPVTRTPVVATAAICLLVLLLGSTLSLTDLAQTTSSFTLAAFALVNLSLWRLKGGTPRVEGAFTVPRIVPLIGFLTCGLLLTVELVRKSIEFAG